MEKIISEITRYKNIINLEYRFDYNFSLEECNFLSVAEKDEINSSNNIFQKNVKLKQILNAKLKVDFDNPDIHYWIVKNWGGINNFKRNDKNDKRITDFIGCLKNNKVLRHSSFSSISSLSKIASFAEPDNYFIYDSRVIFTLNWLLLKYPTNKLKYFPTPVGRNKIINDFNLQPIINYKNINFISNYNSLYYEYGLAYQQYCDMIKNISEQVFPNEKSYLLEMLLFIISINEIFEDIKIYLQIVIDDSF